MLTNHPAIWALALLLIAAPAPVAASQAKPPEELPAAAVAKLDLNRASSAQLRQLPGIDRVWARRIIASRPYRSVAELKKAGLGPSAIAQLSPLVTVVLFKAPPPAPLGQPATAGPLLLSKQTPTKVDLNSASLEQLQNLPGMEPGMAAHILAGRPYANIDDLARNGVPLSTISKIQSRVIFGP